MTLFIFSKMWLSTPQFRFVLFCLFIQYLVFQMGNARKQYNREVEQNIKPLVNIVFQNKTLDCQMRVDFTDNVYLSTSQDPCKLVCNFAVKASKLRYQIKMDNRDKYPLPGLVATIFDQSRIWLKGREDLSRKGCSRLLIGSARPNKGVGVLIETLVEYTWYIQITIIGFFMIWKSYDILY